MYKKPKSFKDLMFLQKVLDKEVSKPRKSGFVPRDRTFFDIRVSCLAEIIEFNEETLYSHKTWKEKEYDPKKEKVEAIDILFFFVQYANKAFDEFKCEDRIKVYEKMLFEDYGKTFNFKEFLKHWADGLSFEFLKDLMKLFASLGMTKEDILEGYWNKWNINMKRPNKTW